MFDTNEFKRTVKIWMREHPNAPEEELRELCEDLIPSTLYTRHGWLIDHTVSWYRHVVSQRSLSQAYVDDGEELAS